MAEQGPARPPGRTIVEWQRIGLVAFFALAIGVGLVRGDEPRQGEPAGPALAITGVTVFDGERFIEDRTVFLRGDTIEAVRGGDADVAAGVEVVEGEGRTLLPGFIDTHVHLALTDPRAVLRNGITTARDLAWPLGEISELSVDAIYGLDDGPALRFAGPMLTAPGGYPARAGWAPRGTALEVADAASAAHEVRELIRRSVSVIKVAMEPRAGPMLAPDVLRAIVDAAREAGVPVTCHCGGLDALEIALDAGVRELAHGLWSDEAIPDATIDRMVRDGVVVVPTLHIDPSAARVDNLRRFVAAGGRVVYGTDMGNPPAVHGIDVEELRLMRDAGMSLTDVLVAATSGAASYLGLDAGRVEPGAPADLVLVEGDPREDLGVLADPVIVARAGRFVA